MNGKKPQADYDLNLEEPVKISEKAYLKMKYMTEEMGNDEIVGVLIAEDLKVKDVLIFEQDVSHGECELDTGEFGDFLEKIADEHPQKLSQVKGTWHSHNTMGCFRSQTDKTDISNLMSYTDYLITIVTSKTSHFQMHVRIDMNTEFGKITLDNMNFEIEVEDEELKEEVKEEMEEKVNRKTDRIQQGRSELGDEYWAKVARRQKKDIVSNGRGIVLDKDQGKDKKDTEDTQYYLDDLYR